MEFIIEPYVGVGKFKFGMTQNEIKVIANEVPMQFKKFEDDEYETEAYKDFFVYYKNPGICEAIEFFSSAIVIFNGMNILKMPYIDVEEYFLNMDKDLNIGATGFISFKYGIALSVPDAVDEPSQKPEGVLVFDKGYYDKYN